MLAAMPAIAQVVPFPFHTARADTLAAASTGSAAAHQRAHGQEPIIWCSSADPAQYICRPPYAVSQRGDGLRIARAPANGLYEHLRALNRAARTFVRRVGISDDSEHC